MKNSRKITQFSEGTVWHFEELTHLCSCQDDKINNNAMFESEGIKCLNYYGTTKWFVGFWKLRDRNVWCIKMGHENSFIVISSLRVIGVTLPLQFDDAVPSALRFVSVYRAKVASCVPRGLDVAQQAGPAASCGPRSALCSPAEDAGSPSSVWTHQVH